MAQPNDTNTQNTKSAQEVAKETAQSKLDELARQLGKTDPSANPQQTQGEQEKDEQEHKKQADADDKAHTHSSDFDKGSPVAVKWGGLLAKVGSYLANKGDKKVYRGVDLNADSHAKHAFYVQGASIGGGFAKAIFGQKASTAQSLASKFVSEDKLSALSEDIYQKVATLSHTWAVKSLPVNPKTLTASEKDELATHISDQNRTLAVMGGASGFLGLTGVVVDTAWLLLIALRTVYQLALIYDKPLTGKEGIVMAYGVLAGANLDKTQEKQVILTTLALAGGVLNQANEHGLKEELIKLSNSNNTLNDFNELLKFTHLDKFADKYNVDIDRFNTRWLRHLTTLTAVGVGAYYNRLLIDEVIGTAMATFKQEMAMIEYQV